MSAFSFVPSPALAATQVLQQHWNGQLPVDLAAIAQRMGVAIRSRSPFEEPAFPYSGYFEQTPSGPCIHVNISEPAVRQRFTVAHELGHYVLGHKDSPRDSAQNFGSGVVDPRERAANQFAAELLMPSDAVRRVVASGQFNSVNELAQAFQVSGVAMGYRLNNLQLPSL